MALRLALEGGAVALVDRSVLVDEVRHEIEAQGGTAVGVTADLETYAGATAAMRATQERFGRIDLLVNNVGGTIWAMPYAEFGEAQIEAEIRRSLFPTLWCCRAVLPAMLEGGGGVIVNVSSIATRGVNRVPLCGGQRRRERHHRLPRLRICSARHTGLRCGARRHRGAATPHSRATRDQ